MNAKILVIDDVADERGMLTRRLRLRGYDATWTSSASDALQHLAQQRFDLVVVDFDMPGGRGDGLLREIRASFSLCELPVIVATKDPTPAAMGAALDAGANDWTAKPFELDWLVTRMAAQLRFLSEFRRVVAAQARLQRRLQVRARMEELGFGDPKRRALLMRELQNELPTGSVSLVYQPQLHLRSGEIGSVEALIRWNSPVLGPVAPSEFIPIAEETGDIAALTEWTIERALRDRERLASRGRPVRMTVNLSASLASDSAFASRLLDLMGPHAEAVGLELTESAIFGNGEEAVANLARFAASGLRIGIDDYGSGMSSLAYLQSLPVHELKIDRSFVSRLTQSQRDPLIVRSTIELAHALELEVVAEGVEDQETLALLRVMGCDLAQGNHVGVPMSVEGLLTFLEDGSVGRLNAPLDINEFLKRAIIES
jgi:EAL domain-containing protein (putative c-di-GMP-specific phosphodiesterase class I)/DNA-binding NarL/FixJ family response regulator